MISYAYAQTLAPASTGFSPTEIIIGIIVIVVALGVVAFKEGWLTPATQATIMTDIANLEAQIKAAAISLETKFGVKTTPVIPVVPVAPAPAVTPAPTTTFVPAGDVSAKSVRIADNKAMLIAGTIDQAQYDAAVAKILAQ